MKFKAKILYLEKWEKREQLYYHRFELPSDGEYDFIFCDLRQVFPIKERILKNLYSVIGKYYGNKIPFELNRFYDFGITLSVKRPHDYKKGDIVEVDFNVSVSKGIKNEQ